MIFDSTSRLYLRLTFSIGVTLLALPARAKVDVRGFGTGGLLYNSESRYLGDWDSYGKRLGYSRDSRLGLNLNAPLTDEWSAKIQLTGLGNSSSFMMNVDWAFVSYAPSDSLTVRAGRILNPVWMISESIDIGLSNPWIRPPVEVYNLNPIKSVNGLSLISNWRVAPGHLLSGELGAGVGTLTYYQNRSGGQDTVTVKIREAFFARLNYNWDDIVTVHASYARTRVDANVASYASLAALNPLLATSYATNILTYDLGLGQFFGVGAKLEYQNFLVMTEYAHRIIGGTALPKAQGAYVTFGYEIWKFLPHITVAGQWGLTGTSNFHPDYPTVTALRTSQWSLGGGVKFTPIDSVDIKLEAQKTQQVYTDAAANLDFWVFSSAVDFVF